MKDRQPMNHVKLVKEDISGDMLKDIFTRQNKLCSKYKFWNKLSKEKSVIVYADYIASEAQELKNEANWKMHKETKHKIDDSHIIFEYIDILHMVVSGLIKMGVTPKQCHEYYVAKNKENHARIERKY